MEDLKLHLANCPHVQTVYFDAHGNWFLHKGRTIVSEKSREEILNDNGSTEETEPEGKKGKNKK